MEAQLNHIDMGKGQPIVLLHGLYGCADTWRPIARVLSQHLRVITMDLRNHGHSPHIASHTYHDMALDVLATLRHLGIERAHMLGHSMGGRVAIMLAQLHPQSVGRLVLADIGPESDLSSPNMAQRLLAHQQLLSGLSTLQLDDMRTFAQAEAAMLTLVPSTRLRRSMLKNLERSPSGAFRWRLNLPVLARHLPDVLRGVATTRLPSHVLLLRGGRSAHVSARELEQLQQLCPGLQCATLAHAGHWLHTDSPHEVASLTLRFALQP
ncbi:MAG: alpha/beta fold hydrolase [Bacteroidales bacterium]|nr:alpha/beta fold hydrolase [Bacteroidales bacterium]